MSSDLPSILLIAGIAILSATLIRSIILHRRRTAKRITDRRAAIQAAREAERKRLAMLAEPPKVKLATGTHAIPERVPLGDPHDVTFTGGVPPRSIAKWETEIHQIGRQMIGQIDSKSVVLQTLTREANRAANRLEILIDHLETFLKNSVPSPQPSETEDSLPPTEHPNLISDQAVAATSTAFADVLEELENELDQFNDPVEEPPPQVTILKAVPTIPESVSETPVIPVANVTTLSHGPHRISVQSKEMEFSVVSTPSPPPSSPVGTKPFTSLFDDSLVRQPGDPVAALGLSSIPTYQTPLIEQTTTPKPVAETSMNRFVSELGASFDLQREVEMRNDFGYTPKQIAEDLNITVGEVELRINLRN